MLKKLLQVVWKIFWVSVSLVVIYINLVLLADALMALTNPFWISTRGRVVSTDGFVNQARYRPYVNITYEYYAGGERYISNKVCFLELPFGCLSEQLEQAASYDAGDATTVYYSPFFPQNAVLIRKTEANQWLAFIISLPITWIGSLIAFLPGWNIVKNIKLIKKENK